MMEAQVRYIKLLHGNFRTSYICCKVRTILAVGLLNVGLPEVCLCLPHPAKICLAVCGPLQLHCLTKWLQHITKLMRMRTHAVPIWLS
jgi:hypothetical protein